MKTLPLILATLASLAVSAPNARADFMMEFGQNNSTPVTAFTVPGAGGRVDVQVYLVETGGMTLQTENLFSAGLRLSWSDASVARVLSTADIAAAPAFDVAIAAVTSNYATLEVAAFANPLVGPDGQNRILLGTFSFTAEAPGLTTLTLADLNATTADFVTGAGNTLDASLGRTSATLTVAGGQPLPEPSGLLMLGMGSALLGVWRVGVRLRRRHGRGSNGAAAGPVV